ncbi:hypothetical protein J2Y45_003081 [Dyadobacter sp. BE34]|uniref:Uncharacterized protein n=1 Tax=Dyadobacter fermentans TaxID=94254 RepID=A0ABU1QTX1_9BACT|nr:MULTISPECIES: hypothetical protein [Dyadobacter]MDR6804611.1 hypothetical protein [Dyadobacter fermentans]MDR7043630.1 hypothetical protein [Dyadobacter sp. BE242]MDR7197942.1 hypothetical protein [Dyadobacter sp. BE34]MDR7214625.1 hypothetical protein [Dyadobacter sp. BE31]MDR7262160.1 hypothetical protein [Dyadobacter sp. BE32]
MDERELTDLEKEAEKYFESGYSIPRADGFGHDHYKFIGTSKLSVDTAVLRKLKSEELRTYPLQKLVDFYKDQEVKVQAQRNKAKS